MHQLCGEVGDRFPSLKLGVHLHDTNGMALANAVAAAQAGVTTFESSICGLGGGIRFPFGPQRYGNVATEDLVNMFYECGADTGIDPQRLVQSAGYVSELLAISPISRAAQGATKVAIREQGANGPIVGSGRLTLPPPSDLPGPPSGGDALPLQGLRVLDLSSLLAAPMASMYLGDFGADVIKVEDPVHGDGIRSWGLAKNGVGLMSKLLNRNKRCITLNLRHPEGQAIARRLATLSDVVIENFRPGTLEAWGLGFDALRSENKGLVMARITGYGQNGPYSDRPGFGTTGEAYSGFAARNGARSGPPTLASFGLGDTATAIFAAFGIMIALRHAADTGRGQYIDLSLYDALFMLLGSHVIDFDQLGFSPGRTGSALPFAAPRNTYPTADGEWVVLAGPTQRTFERLCKGLGLSHLRHDERFATNSSRIVHIAELDKEIEAVVGKLTLSDVLSRMEDAGAPASPALDIADVLADPHMVARVTTVTVDDEDLGPVRMQNVVPRLSESSGSVRWAGPLAGAHNRSVYVEEMGMNEEDLDVLRAQGVI